MTADLEQFVSAQDPVWEEICAELQAGRKQTHWMWFVFPQVAVLARSATSRRYGLAGLPQARAYLAHPVLGRRLMHCCEWLGRLHERTAVEIFGVVDAMKLRSCLSLFIEAAPSEPLFRQCLDRYFDGVADPLTKAALG